MAVDKAPSPEIRKKNKIASGCPPIDLSGRLDIFYPPILAICDENDFFNTHACLRQQWLF